MSENDNEDMPSKLEAMNKKLSSMNFHCENHIAEIRKDFWWKRGRGTKISWKAKRKHF